MELYPYALLFPAPASPTSPLNFAQPTDAFPMDPKRWQYEDLTAGNIQVQPISAACDAGGTITLTFAGPLPATGILYGFGSDPAFLAAFGMQNASQVINFGTTAP